MRQQRGRQSMRCRVRLRFYCREMRHALRGMWHEVCGVPRTSTVKPRPLCVLVPWKLRGKSGSACRRTDGMGHMHSVHGVHGHAGPVLGLLLCMVRPLRGMGLTIA